MTSSHQTANWYSFGWNKLTAASIVLGMGRLRRTSRFIFVPSHIIHPCCNVIEIIVYHSYFVFTEYVYIVYLQIYRGIYKHQPFSQQPNLDSLSLLWTPMNARVASSTLELYDIDDTVSGNIPVTIIQLYGTISGNIPVTIIQLYGTVITIFFFIGVYNQ